jgi:integrase/recombinase XerD
MRALLGDFLEWSRTRRYSEATLSTHENHLRRFIAWCDERSLIEQTDVTQPIIERYQRWLYYHRRADGRPISVNFQNSLIRSVRVFFRWLTRQHLTLFNPASEIELGRRSRRLPRNALTAAEAECVISQPDVTTPMGIRDRAILETFYATGIRRMELAGLELYDLDWDRGTLMVREGKGRKDRLVPIGERALSWIEKYVSDVRSKLVVDPDERHLFLTMDGLPFAKLDSLTILVCKYVAQANITKKGGCHLFRHAVATLMLENGADIRFIQEMLGHEDLSSTQVYTHVSIAKLKQIYKATHPAEQSSPSVETTRQTATSPELVEPLDREVEEERDTDTHDKAHTLPT